MITCVPGLNVREPTAPVPVAVPDVPGPDILYVIVTGPLQSLTGVGAATVVDATQPAVFGVIVWFAGQVNCGLLASTTTTFCEHELVLPFTSVTVQITTVVPIGY